MSREDELRKLNEQYVKGVAGRRRRMVSPTSIRGFCLHRGLMARCSTRRPSSHDGTRSDLAEYRLTDVNIRFYGDVALVRCTGAWKARNGTPGLSRYTDILRPLE